MPAITESPATTAESLVALLDDARARTLELVAPVSEDDLQRQHDPLMGPIIWDLGHIAHFEELWLLHNTAGPIRFGEMPGTFNPFEHPRRSRGALALPSRAATLAHMAGVRERVAQRIASLALDGDDPLQRDGYVVRMVAQHEHQHGETILQTLQLKQGAPYTPLHREPPRVAAPVERGMVRFPGGRVTLGTDDRAWAYDNERPRHAVELAPFWIDRTPVTNADWLAFMEAGGYRERRWWGDEGWAWLQAEPVDAPRYWFRRGGEWHARTMDRSGLLHPDHPVCHVCCHEAEAYARWAGKRLPTEAEWEAAATWDPQRGEARAWPWGDAAPDATRANVDQLAFGTAPVGACPQGASPIGCLGMIGDVWEWTSTGFDGYPGFQVFPYAEYSAAFFGSAYRVLRGGSWATRAPVARATFRNWDYPMRRQIFSGVRCARDDA